MIHALAVIGILLAIVLLVLLVTFNTLMDLRQHVRVSWATMDEQLKKRYELIQSLNAAVQSAGAETLAKLPAISAARNQAAVAYDPTQLVVAESALTAAIQELLNAADLDVAASGNSQFVQLRQKLIASEKDIEKSRRRYNTRVENLNQSLRTFPIVITAKLIGLKPQAAFESPVI